MPQLPPEFVFSQSNLQDYVDCKRRFELRYLKRQRWPAPEVDNMLAFEERMELGARFHRLIQQHLVGIPADTLKRRLNDPNLATWFDAYLTNGLDNLPAIRYPERTLSTVVDDALLMAKFDLVALPPDDTGRVVIIDWKTSQREPRQHWLKNRLQTIVYRYVMARAGQTFFEGNQRGGIAPNRIEMRYWYAQHDGLTLSFPYDRNQFDDDDTYLRGLIQDIRERQDFPLTDETKRCRFCTYRSLCDRGITAGSLDEYDALDYDASNDSFEIDLDQIAEIEF